MAEKNKTRVDESLSKGTFNKSLTGNSDQRVDLTNYEVSPSGNIQPGNNKYLCIIHRGFCSILYFRVNLDKNSTRKVI